MRVLKAILAAAVLFGGPVSTAQAQELLGSYIAYIGNEDLYNSKGARLGEAWQIIRQDRANYHRFGIRHAGDEWDPFFGDFNNRAAMEGMIRKGYINPQAARDVIRGGATVVVEVYGYGSTGTSVNVDVYR